MFIRPVGVTVRAARRRPGRPLLRGLLTRAAGAVEETEPPYEAEPEPEEPEFTEPEPEPEEAPGLHAEDEPRHEGPAPSAGLVAELRQLADLAREGLLTPQEFTTAKARLLRD
ncbi:SHOCT domain-containing protein [Streptomyces sp. NPDC054956]